MKKPELLAPAGNMESMKAAINAGCDAIYLGGKSFGARSFAQNFSDEELIETIKYAHIRGVKIYVTVNTLIFENEVDEFMQYIDFLHRNNVDAIIIQDLGMMDLIRKTYPNLEIHASTQMHIHNLEGVKLAEKLGIKRTVLARETDINTIEKIKKNTNIELEIFIHGALCVSYSGQCLMSYFMGSRSGNRGTCAQCCRMKYDLLNNSVLNKNKYPLSTKDLCTIDNIGKLIDIGVDSLKIEGRMKRPEYVYIVTKLYRKAIDNYIKYKDTKITKEDMLMLYKIFNREFTQGFLFNEDNNNFTNEFRPNHMGIKIGEVVKVNNNFVTIKLTDNVRLNDGIRIIGNEDIGFNLTKIYKDKKTVDKAYKNDLISIYVDSKVSTGSEVVKTTDKELMDEIDKALKTNKKIDIDIVIKARLNKNLELIIKNSKNEIKVISDYVCENAIKNPMTKDSIKKQIDRLKETAYKLNNLEIDMDDNIFVDIKELNKIRREAIDLLNDKRCYKIEYKKCEYKTEVNEYNEKGLNVLINDSKSLKKIKDLNISNIYSDKKIDNTILRLPRVINEYEEINEPLLISEFGSLNKYKNFRTDSSFNVTNSYAVAFLNNLGSKIVTLSYENTFENIKQIIINYIKRYNKTPNLEVIVSSIPEVMITKYNILDKYNIDEAYLKNEKGYKFLLKRKNNNMIIYNHEKIKDLEFEKYYDIGVNYLRVEINDQDDIFFTHKINKFLK